MYNVQFWAQIFEGKIRMCIIHGYNNPMYNAHENIGAHNTWQNMVISKATWWVRSWLIGLTQQHDYLHQQCGVLCAQPVWLMGCHIWIRVDPG